MHVWQACQSGLFGGGYLLSAYQLESTQPHNRLFADMQRFTQPNDWVNTGGCFSRDAKKQICPGGPRVVCAGCGFAIFGPCRAIAYRKHRTV